MSDDIMGALLEAERRGLLPPEKLEALREGRKRGFVPAALEGSKEIPTIDPMPLVPGVDWGDVATQGARGFNQGIDNTLNLPRTAANLGARGLRKLGVMEDGEDPLPSIPFATRLSSLNNEEARTWLGERAHSTGEFAGAAALPGGLISRFGRAATPASVVSPARGATNYLASSAVGGAAQDAAHYLDLGPGWEMAAGVLGSGVGGAVPSAAIGAAKGARSLYREAYGDAKDVRSAALDQNANALAAARTDANSLLERVIPERSVNAAHGITNQDVANMVIRRERDGATPTEIAQDYPNVNAGDVQNYLNSYDARNKTPMSVYDLAKEERNVGGAAPVVRLGKATSGLSPDSETAAGIEGRQLGQSERAQDIIQDMTQRAELQRRQDLAEKDYRVGINKPSGVLSPSEQSALNAKKAQAEIDFARQRASGREMESAREDLTKRNRQEFDDRYTTLHSQPDVPLTGAAGTQLADIIADPLAKKAWNNALTLAQDKISPSADEVAKSFGIRNKTGLGIAEEGTPSAPHPGQTAEAQYNLRQMDLEAQIEAARKTANKAKDPIAAQRASDRADELENLKEGLSHRWETRSVGQYPVQNQQTLAVPVRTLDYFQRELRDEAKVGGSDGNVINSFRQRLLDTLDPENPGAGNKPVVKGFRDLMEDYRNYRTGDEAFDLGRKMGQKEGPTNSEAMSAFRSMTPTQQHLFRLGRSRGMLDVVRGRNEGQNAVAPFMNEGARETNRAIFGNAIGERLNQDLGRENITTGTHNELYRGSQTAEKASDMEKARGVLNTAVGMAVHRPLSWVNNLGKRLEYHIGERQAGDVLKQLGSTQPEDMLQTLVDLSKRAKSAGEQQSYVQAIADMRSQHRRAGAAASVANALAR